MNKTFIPLILLLFGSFQMEATERIFTGANNTESTNKWSYALNWDGGVTPDEGDSLVFTGNPGNRSSNTNDFTAGTAFSGITFGVDNKNAYTLNGNSILLTGDIISNTALSSGDGNVIKLDLHLDDQTRTINVASGSILQVDGDIIGTGGLIKTGDGILTLNSAKSFSGGLTVQAGILRSRGGSESTFGSGPLVISHGAVVDLRYSAMNVSSLSGGGTITSTAANTRTVVVDTIGIDTFSGVIENGSSTAISLTKKGSGTLVLTGANTYTGKTIVNDGKLLVNGSLANTNEVSVQSGGILTGSGFINGASTIQADGMLSPGDGVGTLAFGGDLTLSKNGIYYFEGGDLVTVAGMLTLPSSDRNKWILSLQSGFQDGGEVVLFNYETWTGVLDAVDIRTDDLGFTPSALLTLTDTGSSIVLQGISVIPEPSALLLFGLSLAAMLILCRRLSMN